MSRNIFSKDGFIFFDGAMGTMLQKAGLKVGDLPEVYNFSKPEVVMSFYQAYIDAGADILTTNTFSSNELKLKNSGYFVEDSVSKGIEIAKRAAKGKMVALDIGPIGQLMEPMGTLSFDRAYEMFARQVKAGTGAGADLILIETMTDLYEAKAAVLAAKENSSFPVICTLSFQQDGRTLSGADPLTAVTVLEGLGVDALGVNCSLGPAEMVPIVEQFLAYAHVPIIVQPNAGLPKLVKGETVYDMSPEEFAQHIKIMAEKGVRIVGGCCGTRPEFIKESRARLEGMSPVKLKPESVTAVSSGSRTVIIGDNVTVIGERINPTGRKKLKEALKTKNFDYILNEAVSQRNAGANILDINVGLPEIDEKKAMLKVVREVQAIVGLPLQIDSTKPDVIEAGVRYYNGKPLINSVSGEPKSLERILPIVKKYGACVVGLTLDKNGVPESAEGRVDIAKKILKAADSYGIPRWNVLIDCLVLTASAQQQAAVETLRALEIIKGELDVKTVLGISNVSFGLPRRDILNRTYLGMALATGLDAPIINPMASDMMETISAFRTLANKDKGAKEYISIFAGTGAQAIKKNAPAARDLKEIVINGIRDEAASKTKELLRTEDSMNIMETYLMPALEVVGSKYEKGEIFLPQLIQSAETVKKAFEVIKAHFSKESIQQITRGKIVLATVKGDVHDIGKNIVKILLENYGFEVLDLGKDVPTEEVVSMAKEHNIKLVGLSALMTTTVKSMKDTISALRQENIQCGVMVGGAVLNEEYADMIGADFYARDAQGAIGIAQKVFKGVKI